MRSTNKSVKLADLNLTIDAAGNPTFNQTVVPYQHPHSADKVETIVKDFDETFVICPVVSARKDGSLVVVDGQHRVLALVIKGYDEWPCEVYTGLTLAAEARLYRVINGERRRVASYDLWNADLVAKDPVTLGTKRVVDTFGLTVGPKVGPTTLACPVDLRVLYSRAVLADVLNVFKTWGFTDQTMLEGSVLLGYARFMRHFPTLIPELEKGGRAGHPSGIHRNAMGRRVSNTMLHAKDIYAALRLQLGV